jgi:membrane-associated phospholipid phosphatase
MVTFKRIGAFLTIAGFIASVGCNGGESALQQTLPLHSDRIVRRTSPNAPLNPGTQAVVDWNVIALNTTASAPFNPPLESRNLAIVQGAVYDAVVTVTGGYRPYLFAMRAARGASPVAAIATAAHDALVGLYPAQQPTLDTVYASYIGAMSGADVQAGVDVGHKAAAGILSRRSNDGSSAVVSYTPGTAPGEWQPTPPLFKPALDPGWGKVTTFLLRSGDQFRPGPPPVLTSDTYTQDFNEIINIGSATSATRTADQTALAQFWVSTAPQVWNQAVQQLAIADGLDVGATARAFAALNLAGADAFIGAWDAKFTYNQWRPVTAIQRADTDGNPQTVADSAWTPLLVTPPFPDYPAGHAVYAGAAETMLTSIFGASPRTFQLTSHTAPGAVYQYTSFDAVAADVVNARVYGGIHWRTSCIVGRALGQSIANFDLKHGLQPAGSPSSHNSR